MGLLSGSGTTIGTAHLLVAGISECLSVKANINPLTSKFYKYIKNTVFSVKLFSLSTLSADINRTLNKNLFLKFSFFFFFP